MVLSYSRFGYSICGIEHFGSTYSTDSCRRTEYRAQYQYRRLLKAKPRSIPDHVSLLGTYMNTDRRSLHSVNYPCAVVHKFYKRSVVTDVLYDDGIG